MQRIVLVSCLAVLAGCPPKRTGPATAASGVGCPDASGVYVASYVRPGEGEQGYTGWVLPLANVKVDSVKGVASYAQIDAAAASAAGVPAPPPQIWLMPANAAICKATIGSYYAAAIDAKTPNIAYGVELTGCAAPSDPQHGVAIALASPEIPGKCRALPPRPVAARLGETNEKTGWIRPTKETPIPAAFAAIVPPKDCRAPGCEMLWSIAQVDIDKTPVAWSGAVNWLEIPAGAKPESACQWKVETFSGFFIAGPDGKPVKVTDGQDHPLALTAVLADDTGPRALLAEGTGEYTAYDLRGGTAAVGRHLVWLVDNPEAYADLGRIGPECGP
jgi:hypothetical protein